MPGAGDPGSTHARKGGWECIPAGQPLPSPELTATKDIQALADEELMHLVRAGDPRAFETVYDRHGGAAFSLAYRRAAL